MFEYIDKLRKSPEPVRRRFVIVFSVCVMVVMLAAWGTSLAFRIKSGDFGVSGKGAASSTAASDLGESWQGFLDQVGQFLDSSSAAFKADSYEAATSSGVTPDDGTSATTSAIIDSI